MHTARDMETARDMHTARDFEAASSFEHSMGTKLEDHLQSSRGAPAYGTHRHQERTLGGHESLSGRDNTGSFSTSNRRSYRHGQSPACDEQRDQRSYTSSRPSALERRTEGYSHADGRRQHEEQISGTKHATDGAGKRLPSGFRQSMVEDVFSYARHNRVEELERMMDQGVPVDVRDNFGNTALIVACQNGHKRALKAVLRRGADPNAINARGNTALHFCYAFGYGGTLGRYLMEKGADSSIRNRSGMVCYDGIDR